MRGLLTRAGEGTRPARRGAILIVVSCLALACSSNPPPEDVDGGGVSHLEQALADFNRMGLLAGPPDFPVVGRVITFRGPADSAYVVLAASMPPAALRFAREGGLFSGSYQVLATAVTGADTVLRLNRREMVRLEDFTETASDEERIFFQRFITLPPGSYELTLTLRELTTRDEATRRFAVEVARFDEPVGRISDPVVALRAVPRQAYRQHPPVIVSPRSTATASREPPLLLVEVYDDVSDTLTLRVAGDGVVLWEQVLIPVATTGAGAEDAPRTVLTPLPIARIPPGLAKLTVVTEDGIETHAPVLLALDDEWAFAEWGRVVEHLAHAMPSDSLELWEDAPPAERARLWAAFWDATDLDPATPRNEFLRRHFDRMSEADDRYPEPGIPGWRTDRGRTYVQLGGADREVLRGGAQTGEPRQIEWMYAESLPFEVQLHFVDESDFGIFRLEPSSRLVLHDSVQRLRELEISGEWVDGRETEGTDGANER
jgi:GWxTD domain-containing protein